MKEKSDVFDAISPAADCLVYSRWTTNKQSEEIISSFKVQQILLFLPKSLPLDRFSHAWSNPFR